MVGDRRLRKLYALLDIRGAEADVFADGIGSALFECLQDAPAGGIGYCLQLTA